MKTNKTILLILLLVGMSTNLRAQNVRDTAYYQIARELIADNVQTQFLRGDLLMSKTLLYRCVEHMEFVYMQAGRTFPIKNSDSVLESYVSSSFVDDLASIFVDCCYNVISIDELRRFKEDWDVFKMTLIFDREDVQDAFFKVRESYLKGEFNGIDVPECTASYQSLVNQYYEFSGLQQRFQTNEEEYLGLKRDSIERVKAFYATEPQNFVMLILQKNLPEDELQKCVDYLKDAKRRRISVQMLILSIADGWKIQASLLDKFRAWLKKERKMKESLVMEQIKRPAELDNAIRVWGAKTRKQKEAFGVWMSVLGTVGF